MNYTNKTDSTEILADHGDTTSSSDAVMKLSDSLKPERSNEMLFQSSQQSVSGSQAIAESPLTIDTHSPTLVSTSSPKKESFKKKFKVKRIPQTPHPEQHNAPEAFDEQIDNELNVGLVDPGKESNETSSPARPETPTKDEQAIEPQHVGSPQKHEPPVLPSQPNFPEEANSAVSTPRAVSPPPQPLALTTEQSFQAPTESHSPVTVSAPPTHDALEVHQSLTASPSISAIKNSSSVQSRNPPSTPSSSRPSSRPTTPSIHTSAPSAPKTTETVSEEYLILVQRLQQALREKEQQIQDLFQEGILLLCN
jgi:hypothetical protein